MFAFWQLMSQVSGSDDVIDLAALSPRFREAVATKDDIFRFEGIERAKFDNDRFQQKVMTRWREMGVRAFRRKDGSDAGR